MGIGAASEASEPRTALARAIHIDAEALESAAFGFHRAFPHRSAQRRFFATQVFAALILAAALVVAFRQFPAQTAITLQAAAASLFTIAIFARLLAAAQVAPLTSRLASPAQWPTYTILCPLYREANVAADLIAALRRLDYPVHALDIKFLCESDDEETIAALLSLAHDEHMEVLVAPPGRPRTKPRALNLGLARARGDFVVVFDAEDRPHPHQLRAALAAFEDGGAQLACVQAPLAIDNADDSWIARQFAAEYAIQFNEVLPLLARANLPLPLGGTSNHFRVDALRAAGGWDPHNVREKTRAFAA